ncbi:chemotaxis protein CheB [Sediminibacterium soli]|uniref:chemotaxis protein CheB n=1 Tax=Sediminibacterium soli TaxID=2698829 RepID=UPI001379E730|nr:chemotaxis protein CheB [Sediminibacterium soli]NCI46648.1 chemotaxis protein CheB [Sediminibacterium soli]
MAENVLITAKRVVAIGGSAGSLDVIIRLLPGLDKQLGYAVIIVIHRRSQQDSLLGNILGTKTDWVVKEAEEKEPVIPGYVYLVPSDYHLLVEKDHTLSLDDSEKVNYSRPSIDVTFESAAETYRENLTAVLLSGANADGAAGMQRTKELGGICIVQNPLSAEVSYMPEQAIRQVAVDHIVDAEQLGKFINDLLKNG